MTINEILEQVKKLNQQDREELARRLLDMGDASSDREQTAEDEEHWGKNLIRLMEEIGPIDLIYPEIEDPVEWVKHLRAEQRRRRLGDWGSDE